MAEVFICPKGSIDDRSVRALRQAGVVVVQSTEPERCQFIRASEAVSADDMLWAALAALKSNNTHGAVLQRQNLALRLFDVVERARQRRAGSK